MPVNYPPAPKHTPRWMIAVTLAAMVGIPALILGAVLVATPLLQPGVLDAALGFGPETSPWTRDLVYVAAVLGLGFLMVNFGAIFSGAISWYERRVAGRIQSRIGPNRAGFLGFFVWIADAVKMILKEDLVPAEADALLFRAAPYFVLVGFACTFVVLPFGHSLAVTDLDVGIFYVTSVTALTVVGILISGWSSNSKWALFGGMRSAAQVISYEIPAGLAIFVPVAMAGTLSMQGLIRAQGGFPWEWFAFRNPAALVALFILFTSQLAEANRTPFDLPEAESELVAGYLSEYSGFRFAIFFLCEWGNIWVLSAIAVTLFLGGWQIPGVTAEQIDAVRGAATVPALAWWGWNALSLVVFTAKTLVLCNVVVWLRWTLPRIRVDQMMGLCWKYLVPIAFGCLVFTLFWQVGVGARPQLEAITGGVLFAGAVVLALLFGRRVRLNIQAVQGDKFDLSNW
ncbi:complex I subunit 1/NuoH family protein [Anaeromyxobacter diazotrophicus]|uniref:NADH-quinone oxidoreductase subunit H n=1 Tax=Anaeromyxobacter diazotrophicus TaxID=2590199 RepID=A0A7I9VNC1_9BACT|nr:complex I subunit 1 family protein [Anaeromyxobacter diazotrophicus]GEJ57891.1 NADH-quinone oxidoreductase subunit H [Anaeromyxobacter diazotrophicus]